MSFHVRQLVVCVSTDPRTPSHKYVPARTTATLLTKGAIYTVSAVCHVPESHWWTAHDGVYLAEIDSPVDRHPVYRGQPVPFCASRFRPVDDNRIAIFRQALTSAPKHEEVT